VAIFCVRKGGYSRKEVAFLGNAFK